MATTVIKRIADDEKFEVLFNFNVKDVNCYLEGTSPLTSTGNFRSFKLSSGRYTFYFEKNGSLVRFMEKNVKFRSDDKVASSKALKNQIPDSIIRSLKPTGEPHPDTKAILIDANKSDWWLRNNRIGG